MTVAYPQSSRNGLAGVIQTRCNAGAGGPRLYLAEAGGALPATGILGFVELADFGAPADGVTVSASNGNIGSATASGTIAEAIYADSDGNEVHRTDDVGVGPGFEVALDRLDVIAGDRIKLLADVSYTASLSSPLQVGGLSLWHDAESVSGFGTAGYQVTDLTGNGNHGVQATVGSQPEPLGGGGQESLLAFDGVNDSYAVPAAGTGINGATRWAIVLHLICTVDAPPSAPFKPFTDTAEAMFKFALNNPNGDFTADLPSGAKRLVAAAATTDFSVPTVITVTCDNGTATLRRNGEQLDTEPAVQTVPILANLVFGGINFRWAGGIMRAFVVAGRVPTAAELAVLEAPRAVGSPLSVSGLKVWHHVDYVTGAGTAGYRVADLSGRGNHGTQATTANQPQVVGGELQFTPADHYDINSANLGLGGATQAVFVFRVRAAAANPPTARRLLADAAATAFLFTQNPGAPNNLTFDFPSAAFRFTTSGEFDFLQDNVVTFVFNAGVCTLRVNGAVVRSASLTGGLTAIPALATPEISVGGWNFQWDGAISAFLLVTGRIPTEPELQILEAAAAA